MTKYKIAACALAAAVLAVAPMTEASARPFHHGHGGIFFGVGALGAAVVGTAAVIATAPFVALSSPGYYPAPGYYAPPPGYYAPQPSYYAAPPGTYAPR